MTRRLEKKLFISNSPPIEDSQGSIDENRGLNLIPFDSLALSVSGKR